MFLLTNVALVQEDLDLITLAQFALFVGLLWQLLLALVDQRSLLDVGTHSVGLSNRLLTSTGSLELAVRGALAGTDHLASLLLPHITQYLLILGHIQIRLSSFQRHAAQVLIIVILIFVDG